jgi:membrane peptidoglycan carboxypeptidase
MSRRVRKPILSGPYPLAGISRRRRRVLHRALVLLLAVPSLLLLAGFVVWEGAYPGLQRQVDSIPATVRLSLRSHGDPFTPADAIPPTMQHAIVAIEDRRFYQHHGIDVHGMARALATDITHGTTAEGGATLTVQLVENTIRSGGNPLVRVARTVALAWVVEDRFTKQQILDLYLNDVYFGRGAYGIAAAARTYFGTVPATLGVGQAVFLAALPQAPSLYARRPYGAPVQARWRTVLADMASQGFISRAEESGALANGLRFRFASAAGR